MGEKFLVVGCGITGTIAAKLLQSKFGNVTIWEKLSEPGGRFCTLNGGKNGDLLADLGAQYITTTDAKLTEYGDIYSTLCDDGIITPMNNKVKGMRQSQCNMKNFLAPAGMKSVVKHMLGTEKCNVYFRHELMSLRKHHKKWHTSTISGKEEVFDVVILTIPVPEILKLSGDLESNDNVYSKLKDVKYSSRFALGFFFDEGVCNEFDSEYIDDDPVVRFVSYGSRKSDSSKFHSASIHTTIQFGEENKDKDQDDVERVLIKHITESTFPSWPQPSTVSKWHWVYSQVLQPYDSKPGAVTLLNNPLLIAGGDGFIGSTFDQCIFSAKIIFDTVLKHFEC